ncbi:MULTISPECIES: N-acetylmuramoyl-L-alanine amidase family protein [Bacillus]|uniref:Cell wall hydrolase n=2 Tax=Bacillus TaxID=1386 RepID=A0A0M4FSD1_9BACI|nr:MULTISPECIES: N-acetylmuramoyl-L-alanine amidase [Bacillus]ALC82434.1 cell wall hydrolase [Bacillus gobiensis]MBP1081315.1 N-acetylmuramoyl-L-alanine amidase [Bacillus capparidis]MED1095994.1 N-acetylmuramoyl-L-alanine amidase [Bacillus capparidis]
MKIFLDAGHGYQTPGKRTVDGMKEYEFNRDIAEKVKTLLKTYSSVQVSSVHSDKRDVPLKERTALANKASADLYLSIHANASGNGKEWNDVNGIETFVYLSKPTEATSLAQTIQNELIKATERKNRGVKLADFHVLRETKMTAILCECGFMTNKEEAALLKTPAYRQACAEAITKGITGFYKLKRKRRTKHGSSGCV